MVCPVVHLVSSFSTTRFTIMLKGTDLKPSDWDALFDQNTADNVKHNPFFNSTIQNTKLPTKVSKPNPCKMSPPPMPDLKVCETSADNLSAEDWIPLMKSYHKNSDPSEDHKTINLTNSNKRLHEIIIIHNTIPFHSPNGRQVDPRASPVLLAGATVTADFVGRKWLRLRTSKVWIPNRACAFRVRCQ